MSTGKEARELVDITHGVISREIFVSDEIFRKELENLFPRTWLFVGHASQVPNPGDYFSSWMGADPVLLTRDSEGQLHVLLNSCRHRGMQVCRYDVGNTLRFTCPYHGWSYSTNGALVDTPGDLHGVPHIATAYTSAFEKKKWGLVHAPKLANYKGLVFACWDESAPDFDEYVGDFHYWLDNLTDAFDGTEAGTEVFFGVQKWRVKSNWKFIAEGFCGDTYHGATTHRSVESVGIGPGGKGRRRHGENQGEGSASMERYKTGFRSGHGAADNLHYELAYPRFSEKSLDDYFVDVWNKRKEKLTAQGRPLGGRGPANLFPNMSFAAGFPRSIMVSHPKSPTETEVWRWYLIDKDAPDHVRDWLRHYYLRYSGPGGMTEQDDMENWDYATKASQGVIARRYPYNYQQGLGTEVNSELKGARHSESAIAGEVNIRWYYQRWAEFIDELSWTELMQYE